MNKMKIIERVERLLDWKDDVEKQITAVESDKMNSVDTIVLRFGARNKYPLLDHKSQHLDRERLYSKIKYLLLAELKESLDEINAEIDSLVEFKGVDE